MFTFCVNTVTYHIHVQNLAKRNPFFFFFWMSYFFFIIYINVLTFSFKYILIHLKYYFIIYTLTTLFVAFVTLVLRHLSMLHGIVMNAMSGKCSSIERPLWENDRRKNYNSHRIVRLIRSVKATM